MYPYTNAISMIDQFPLIKENQNEFILSIVSVIIIGISAIILALSENVSDKSYQKKFIMVSYLTYYIQLQVLSQEWYWPLFTYLCVSSLATLNLLYSNKADYLEIELNKVQLFTYEFFRWFFITKSYRFLSYIFLYYGIEYFSIKYLPDTVSSSYYQIFIIISTIVYATEHLIGTAMDTFDMKPFSLTKEIITSSSNDLIRKITDEVKMVNLLAFLVAVEDQDFFIRKQPVVSIKLIIRRKLKMYNEGKRKKVGNNKRPLLQKVQDYLKLIIKIITKICNILRNYKKYVRGYSTIQCQFVRSHCMSDNSYKYTYRRKLFTELIYTPFFYMAWIKWMKRTRFWNISNFRAYTNIMTLLAYYNSPLILNGELDEKEFFDKFKSRHSKSFYEARYKKFIQKLNPIHVEISEEVSKLYELAKIIDTYKIDKDKKKLKNRVL